MREPGVRYDPFEYELGDWLRSYCHNLEYLEIQMNVGTPLEVNADRGYFEEQKWVINVLRCLQSFTNLKALGLAVDFDNQAYFARNEDSNGPQLDFVEILPTSIATLSIRELGRTYPNHIADSLCRLAESEKHPNLYRVSALANSTLPRDVSHLGWSVRLDKENPEKPDGWRYIKMSNDARRLEQTFPRCQRVDGSEGFF
ncbi:hypothetical protein FSARC_15056 [Fusarium sarcochroum]|uniref:Uncharacterized protein n=1 Tax=Fusarium sarcochroum TaxID=1208366 RepID=A0A8H4SNU0_9HYPO|nr:hypothetical protein FSARC_15056 [Fusarium sarcochroum]